MSEPGRRWGEGLELMEFVEWRSIRSTHSTILEPGGDGWPMLTEATTYDLNDMND
jgi:hypothetical protein